MAIVGEAVMACRVLLFFTSPPLSWMAVDECNTFKLQFVSRSEVQVSRSPLTVRPSLSMDVEQSAHLALQLQLVVARVSHSHGQHCVRIGQVPGTYPAQAPVTGKSSLAADCQQGYSKTTCTAWH